MKTWIKRTLIGVLGATVLVGGLTACDSRGEHRHGGGWSEERITEMRGKAIEKVSEKLDLKEVQKQKLAVLADEMLAQRKALRAGMESPRAEMKNLIAGEKFDRTRAQSLLDEKTAAVQMAGPRVIAAMADFYDSLNPAQQAQVRERLDKRHGGWKRG